jgi:hypothetical protein
MENAMHRSKKFPYLYITLKKSQEELKNHLIEDYSIPSEFVNKINAIVEQCLEKGNSQTDPVVCNAFKRALELTSVPRIDFFSNPRQSNAQVALKQSIYCDEVLYKFYKQISREPITKAYSLFFTKVTDVVREAKENKQIYRNSALIDEYLWLNFKRKFEETNKQLAKKRAELDALIETYCLEKKSFSPNQNLVTHGGENKRLDEKKTILKECQKPSEFHEKLTKIVKIAKEKLDKHGCHEYGEGKRADLLWRRRKEELKYLSYALERAQVFPENIPSSALERAQVFPENIPSSALERAQVLLENISPKAKGVYFSNSGSTTPVNFPPLHRIDGSYYENTELHSHYKHTQLYDDVELYKLCKRIRAETERPAFNDELNEMIVQIENLVKQVKAGEITMYRNARHIKEFLGIFYKEKMDQVATELEEVQKTIEEIRASEVVTSNNRVTL